MLTFIFLLPIILAFSMLAILLFHKKTLLKIQGKPYLMRYTLMTTPWFSIKLHKLLMSDPEELHDHPWDYISIILVGGYYDLVAIPVEGIEGAYYTDEGAYTRKWCPPGTIIRRKANVPHKLELPEHLPYSLSLIITSKKIRDWGIFRNGIWTSGKQTSY